MTRSEYDAYCVKVAEFYSREGIRDFSCCEDCCPFFSWRPCECCERPLGGDRHPVNAYHEETGAILEYEVCEDCVYFACYGRLDDDTMFSIAAA